MKEIPSDSKIVICGPMNTVVLPGAKIYQCHECGKSCACSLVGQKLLNEGAFPYCPVCGPKHVQSMIAKGEPPEIIDPTEAIKAAVDFIRGQEDN